MTRTLPVPVPAPGDAGTIAPPVAPAFSSRRPLVLGFLTVAVLVGGGFGWGGFASISGAVIATGQVEVETRDQPVEHIDGGTVGAILVRNGDRVAAGDVLIRLDDAQLRSEAALLEADAAALAARRNRLEAEFGDAPEIDWDAELARRAETDASVRDILDGELRLFEARRSSREGQAAQLRERIGQTRKQIAGLDAQAEAIGRQSGFIGRELDAQRSLFEKGLTELSRLLALEREAARLDGQAGDIAARIAGARGRIAEIEIQILQIDTRRVEEAEGRAREVQAQENQVREKLGSVRRKLGRMEVRAPVAGEVYGMGVNALGEVVRPGESILKIVPDDAELVVVAQLDPIHVDQVHAGQEAVLLFSAFPARVTPEYSGRIERVSADVTRGRAHRFRVVRGRGERRRASGVGRRDGVRQLGCRGCRGRGDAAARGVRAKAGRGGGGGAGGADRGHRHDRSRSGTDPRHAGRGACAHRRALAAQLPGETAHRLLGALHAGGMRVGAIYRRSCSSRRVAIGRASNLPLSDGLRPCGGPSHRPRGLICCTQWHGLG